MVLIAGSDTYIDLRELRSSQVKGGYSDFSCIPSIFSYLEMREVETIKGQLSKTAYSTPFMQKGGAAAEPL